MAEADALEVIDAALALIGERTNLTSREAMDWLLDVRLALTS